MEYLGAAEKEKRYSCLKFILTIVRIVAGSKLDMTVISGERLAHVATMHESVNQANLLGAEA